jgi:hypothetical protein
LFLYIFSLYLEHYVLGGFARESLGLWFHPKEENKTMVFWINPIGGKKMFYLVNLVREED